VRNIAAKAGILQRAERGYVEVAKRLVRLERDCADMAKKLVRLERDHAEEAKLVRTGQRGRQPEEPGRMVKPARFLRLYPRLLPEHCPVQQLEETKNRVLRLLPLRRSGSPPGESA
jgi:hypothetical protein